MLWPDREAGQGGALQDHSGPRASQGTCHPRYANTWLGTPIQPIAARVRDVSLDDYTWTEALPDFVKRDVEGSEVEVFRGAQRLLKEKRPGIICEMHSEENSGVLVEEFSRLGYTSTRCDESHVLALPK